MKRSNTSKSPNNKEIDKATFTQANGKQTNKQTNKQANKQTKQQTTKRTNKHPTKRTNEQTNKQASKQNTCTQKLYTLTLPEFGFACT